MTEIRRTMKCANCGFEATVLVTLDITLSEITLSGKCSRCSNSMQINYSIVDSSAATASTASQASVASDVINIDESLFNPEIPSDAIKDLIDE